MDYVATPDAPKAIGPYSQAVKANGLVYTSGQIALDPATGNLVDGTFEEQVHRVFRNLAAVLKEAGSSFDRVLKATVYVTDLGNFQTLNTIYAEYFGDHKPARTTIQASGLPKGGAVEIDLVALV
ncbi:MAG: 2-iminobutanoate/2-iminopropanoate deaminase [Acidobacteriota bacterium]|jgi:2-iminobutanoate/2-iminopropanoate deaminase|nr:2-iminobutanoate/2-iminopropanoate deaminase [Acidobacteriota bacterium]